MRPGSPFGENLRALVIVNRLSNIPCRNTLPLLRVTLARLFEARDGNTLTFEAYESMAGLEGAIAARAEEVFSAASPAAQKTLDAVLRSLVADMDENGQLTIRTPDRSAVAPGRT